MMLYGFAKLSDEQLQKVRAWEVETGKRLLVFRQFEAVPAFINREQVESLRALEQELGNVVVAVEATE